MPIYIGWPRNWSDHLLAHSAQNNHHDNENKVFIMPPTRRVPEALCFRIVRPSVRPYYTLDLDNTIPGEPLGGF